MISDHTPRQPARWLLLLLFPFPLWAVEDDSGYFQDVPTIMSATRLPQSYLQSPVSSTLIDRQMIRASGMNHLGDVFRLVPGFQVAQASGGHYVVTYHGQEITFPMRIEVMVDGRSVYDNLLSSIKWNTIGVALEDIEQIEVIRGPNAPVFGANALVATVNITTRAAFDTPGTSISTVAGSANTRQVQLRHAAQFGGTDYSISLGYRQDDGYKDQPLTSRDYDSTRLGNLRLQGSRMLNNGDMLEFQGGIETGEASTLLARTSRQLYDHDGDVQSHFQLLRWTREQDQTETSVQITNNYLDRDDLFSLGLLSDLLGSSAEVAMAMLGVSDQTLYFPYADGTSKRTDIEFQQLQKNRSWGQWMWGAGARFDSLSSPHIAPKDEVSGRSGRLLSNLEYKLLPTLSLHAGGILEYNEIVHDYGSARLALNYHVNNNQSLRSSVSYTERSPSIMDNVWRTRIVSEEGVILANFVDSSGGLDVETLTAFEIGYTRLWRPQDLMFDIKLFREQARDLIGFPFDRSKPDPLEQDGAETTANSDRYDIDGIEGQLAWRPRSGAMLALQYCVTDSERQRARQAGVYSTQTDLTAGDIVSLLVAWPLKHGYSIGAGYYHSSDITWIWDGYGQDAYDRFDLRLSRDFNLGRAQASLDLVGQNLGSEHYEYYPTQVLEPTYLARFNLEF